jgi:uncharacterized membrane protein
MIPNNNDSKHRYKTVEMQVYLFNDILVIAKETKDVHTSERYYWQLAVTWIDEKCTSVNQSVKALLWCSTRSQH